MPNVPYSPIPEVSASTQGTPGFDIRASPEAFGSGIGQAVQGLGQTLGRGADQGAQVALARQGMANEATATDSQVNLDKTYTDLYSKFSTLQGKDAVDAQPAFLQSLQDARDAALQASPNPDAQRLLAKGSMYLLQRTMMLGAGHADTQEQQYWINSKQAAIENAAQQGAFLSNSPGQVAIYANQTADAATEIAKHQGMSDEGAAALRATNLGKYYRNVIGTLAQTDPGAAATLFNAVKGSIDGPSQESIGGSLRVSGERAAVADGIGQVMATPVSGAATPASLGIKSAILGQEGSGDTSVSVDGARGQGQIMPATFQQYAHPGESIDNPADNKAVSGRIIDDLARRFNGDPARIAVGYFSGPGNVAPAGSATPWIADKADGNGTTVSAYVSGVMGRLGTSGQASGGQGSGGQASAGQGPGIGGQPAADPAAVHDPAPFGAEFARMQQARDLAAQKFPDRPDLQRQLTEGVWQEIQQANVLQAKYEAEQAKQTRDNQQAAGQGFIKQIMADPAKFDPAALGNDPSLTWEQKNDLFNIAQKHLREVQGGREAQEYGSGFWSAYQAVHSSDPAAQITDPAQLWNRGGPNGDLSLAGIQALTAEINGTRTPEGAAEGQAKKAWFDAAHIAISGHGMFGGQRDPAGEMNFAQFLTAALPELAKEKSAGMTLSQSLGRDGPMQKLMEQFKRSPAQMMQDMLGSNNPDLPAAAGPGAAAAPVRAAVDLSTREGITAAYRDHYFGFGPTAYDAAVREAEKRGFIKVAPAVPAIPSAPTQ